MSRWRKLRELNGAQRRTLVHALALLPVAGLALRLLGLRRARALLGGHSPPAVRAGADARETAWLVAAAARHGPYRASCLPTALALQWLLRRQGIAAELRLGVRAGAGRIEAHAWVEHNGAPLIDTHESVAPFAAFDTLPAAGGRVSN